jgi:nucleoside-diphosphate-sugar epimerase
VDASRHSDLPSMVVTGAPQHLGRHLREAVQGGCRTFVVSDASPDVFGAPDNALITWIRARPADRESLEEAFAEIRRWGGAEIVIYLAADRELARAAFEEYREINLTGLRNVLDACAILRPERVLFAARDETDEVDGGPGTTFGRDLERVAEQSLALLERYRDRVATSRIRLSTRPRAVITGASGLIGRQLVEVLKEDFQVFGIARTAQKTCGVPPHPNVEWLQADICEPASLARVFDHVRKGGGARFVFHLAAYYDFTGSDHPEYWRTNVEGLRNVLEECRTLGRPWFVFASSVAASEFPQPGASLSESSPPDGRHTYAKTKRVGEEMLREYRHDFPSLIWRIGAVFSDWCEYPPLYISLERWRSRVWDRRILGGRGHFAIPYLHIRDLGSFAARVVGRADDLESGEVLIASTDEPIRMAELFELSSGFLRGAQEAPLYMPRALCGAGLVAREIVGRLVGKPPFERSWMTRYIDREMSVDAGRTRKRLGWAPRERLGLVRRLPFIVENMHANPAEWRRRNDAVLVRLRTTEHLRLHDLIRALAPEIDDALQTALDAHGSSSHGLISADERRWLSRILLQQLMSAVRTRDLSIYGASCRMLAEELFDRGVSQERVLGLLAMVEHAVVTVAGASEEGEVLAGDLERQLDLLTMLGRDQVEDVFEESTVRAVSRQLGVRITSP